MDGSILHLLLVLTFAAICQAWVLRKSWALSRVDDQQSLAVLGTRFGQDIAQRARRGQAPDWLHYQAEVDRLLESRDDHLRSLASGALAIGLGVTIFSLLISLLTKGLLRDTNLDPMTLVYSTGASLGGSLVGVAVNLYIVLLLLPRMEKRFSSQAHALRERLHGISSQHPPQEAFTQALKEELAMIRQGLSTEFASAFSTAITGFPRVVEELGVHIERLAAIVKTQGEGIGGAVGDLTRCATAVAAAGKHLQPAAQTVAQATETLVGMPEQLKGVLEGGREGWMEDLREQQQEHVRRLVSLQQQVEQASRSREQQMLTAVRGLQEAVSEIEGAVEQIPAHLAAEVERASGKLGIEFGREARSHSLEMVDRLERDHAQLLERIEHHEQQWRNNIGSVVRELLDQVASQIQEGLVGELNKVHQSLLESAEMLPQVARQLAEAHQAWSLSQEESLEGWNRASDRIRAAAQKLVNADGQLEVAVQALAESSEHLQRVTQVTETFEMSIQEALQQVTSRHLANLDPIRENMGRLVRDLGARQSQFETILEGQSEFIRRLIQQLMKGRQVATLERNA